MKTHGEGAKFDIIGEVTTAGELAGERDGGTTAPCGGGVSGGGGGPIGSCLISTNCSGLMIPSDIGAISSPIGGAGEEGELGLGLLIL